MIGIVVIEIFHSSFSSITFTNMTQNQGLFPSIGSAAAQTDLLSETEPINGKTEEKATQEIESLCMECGQQVWKRISETRIILMVALVGNDSTALDIYSLLPRSGRHVV